RPRDARPVLQHHQWIGNPRPDHRQRSSLKRATPGTIVEVSSIEYTGFQLGQRHDRCAGLVRYSILIQFTPTLCGDEYGGVQTYAPGECALSRPPYRSQLAISDKGLRPDISADACACEVSV